MASATDQRLMTLTDTFNPIRDSIVSRMVSSTVPPVACASAGARSLVSRNQGIARRTYYSLPVFSLLFTGGARIPSTRRRANWPPAGPAGGCR
jgi:hypothetical protein